MRYTMTLFLAVILLSLAACSQQAEETYLPVLEDYDTFTATEERMHIKVGTAPGPYGDLFLDAILPVLAPLGYTVEIIHFEDYAAPNFALANGEIDVNIFQHYRYLNTFKSKYDLDISAIAEIPTVSMGVYALDYESLEDIKQNATLSVPDDASNLSRALMVLESAGLIKLDAAIDKTKATTADIVLNPKNLQIRPIAAKDLKESLDYCDLSVINGNFAMAEGLRLTDALYIEELGRHYFNVIAVRTEDLARHFVQDISDALDSALFRAITLKRTGKYAGFQLPNSLKQ